MFDISTLFCCDGECDIIAVLRGERLNLKHLHREGSLYALERGKVIKERISLENERLCAGDCWRLLPYPFEVIKIENNNIDWQILVMEMILSWIWWRSFWIDISLPLWPLKPTESMTSETLSNGRRLTSKKLLIYSKLLNYIFETKSKLN